MYGISSNVGKFYQQTIPVTIFQPRDFILINNNIGTYKCRFLIYIEIADQENNYKRSLYIYIYIYVYSYNSTYHYNTILNTNITTITMCTVSLT